MKRLIFALCCMLLIVPVMGQTITYSCPADKAIYTLSVVSNSPTHGTFNLNRQDGTTDSGSWSYVPYLFVGNTMSITYNGQTKTQNFITGGKMYLTMSPSRNLTETAETRWIVGGGQTPAMMNIAIDKYGITSPIVGFTLSADNDITYTKTEDSLETINKNLGSAGAAEIMTLAYETFWAAYNFTVDLVYWLKYFFVDNLIMIVALFLAVPMAFAAKNSRGNPERFMRQYFKSLKGFFTFILDLWRMLIETIGTIRGWFRI